MSIVSLLIVALTQWLIPMAIFLICIYFVVKNAIKAALREYAEEKENRY